MICPLTCPSFFIQILFHEIIPLRNVGYRGDSSCFTITCCVATETHIFIGTLIKKWICTGGNCSLDEIIIQDNPSGYLTDVLTLHHQIYKIPGLEDLICPHPFLLLSYSSVLWNHTSL